MTATVTETLRRAALYPELDLPAFPAEYPTRRVAVGGAIARLAPGVPFAITFVGPDVPSAEGLVADLRALIREEGFAQAILMVPEATTPTRLSARLQELGLTPADRPPFEPRGTGMLAVAPPAAGPADVTARRVETLDELRAAYRAGAEAFGMDEATGAAFRERAERGWPLEGESGAPATFFATIDGEVAGFGLASFGRHAAYLSGSGTTPAHRGRGVYRALVRARWEAAVEAGLSALTVSAGAMSRPPLERIGFVPVGEYDVLRLLPAG